MSEKKLRAEINTLRVAAFSIALAVIAAIRIFLLSSEATLQLWWGRALAAACDVIGPSAAIALIWEVLAKRSFLEEILAKVEIREEVKQAGFVAFSMDYLECIDWNKELKSATQVDVFLYAGRTWRGAVRESLRSLKDKKGAVVRIVLPDPDHEPSVSELARRFSTTTEVVKTAIHEAAKDYEEILAGSNLKMWYTQRPPVFALYRIDSVAVISTYRHQPSKGPVPNFAFEHGGQVFGFVTEEFEALIDRTKALARQIYPRGPEIVSDPKVIQ